MDRLKLAANQSVWAFAPFDNEEVDEDGRKNLVPTEIWEHVWNICRDTGYISHGFAPDEGSALKFSVATSDLEKKDKTALNAQLQIRAGDVIIARKGQGVVLGIGIAEIGDREDTSYVFKPRELEKYRRNEDPHPYWWVHCTRVRWLPNSGGLLPANEQAWFVTLRRSDHAVFQRIQSHLTKPIDAIVQLSDGHRPGNPTKISQLKGPNVGSDLLERAIAKLRTIYSRRDEDSELMRLIDAREDVLGRYQPLFSPDGVADISAEQFRGFLNFNNNRHWSGLERLGSVASDMRKLRKALSILLDESQPVDRRLDALVPNGNPKVPKLAQAILTPILLVAHPNKYGVWNNPSTSALKKLGIWPSFRPDRFTGTNYAILNELLLKIAEGVGVDMWVIDALLWRVGNDTVSPATENSMITLLNNLLTTGKTHSVLLYGPAGTGKTHAASELADMYGGPSGGRVGLVQFHPAYAYEDFMEGLRPIEVNGRVTYPVKPGVFREFCEKAKVDVEAAKQEERNPKPFLFVIDEINRGNVPKVMGELMYALEYRGKELKLPYSGEPFSIPENVHILGTMNSSDRSVAMLDVALRRRFHFVELPPRPDLLSEIEVEGTDIELDKLLTALNARILKAKGRHHLLGHSYFLPPKYPAEKKISLAELKLRWFHQILPLLEEYFADDVQTLVEAIIGPGWGETPDRQHFVPYPQDEVDFMECLKWIATPSKPALKGSSNAPADEE